ncbi:hypothetical protein OOK36_13405 [Streptomyces sp. NBC_00365]|uniref:hypothetical protein n=1 Tax=Streptomyces sp. NBC_00365 TaxID=2975726 RepID=UPI00225B6127|nr:hypothetical protein [Streptomyces sp. NBC_00365]MCX5089881.1 hypothetical protein [Streptomyces sp. NBC_00365]
MVEPIYVSVLPTTRAALTAYAQVDLGPRQRIAPLWTVVPRTGPERLRDRPTVPDREPDEVALRRWLTPRVDGLIDVMDGMSGWVDPTHVERLLDASAESLWRLATRGTLRLVTSPEREPDQQWYAADLAFLGGRRTVHQVRRYCDHIADFTQALNSHEHRIGGAAYLYNAAVHDVARPFDLVSDAYGQLLAGSSQGKF